MQKLQHLRVLIVDDSEDMRTLLRRMLGSLGIKQVLEAPNGHAGIEILRQTECDLVLSDLDMKPMDGLEFTHEVRTSHNFRNSSVPIIMITGHTEMSLVTKARDAGITEFIVKPVAAQALKSRLTHITEKPRLFVRSPGYVGPDRRRKKVASAASRRQDDI
jgi:two-component system chemotaxis response regulator CheY